MKLNKPGGSLYVAFIDFRRAFDSVDHSLLWAKLFHLGLSGKIIRTLKTLYDRAVLQIKCGSELTSPIDLTSGVLQGESASPVLYNLFLSDISDFFDQHNTLGLPINKDLSIKMLLYADDLILFGDSYTDLSYKLSILNKYTTLNRLTINSSKTKIIQFSKPETISQVLFRWK